MPNKSVLDDWSDAEIAAFDAEIQRRRFKDYRGLVEWAAGRGLKISRGAAHNRGKMLKQRLEFVKASSLAMEQIADAVKDDSAKASSAVLALVQAEAFEIMLAMQEASEEEDTDLRLERLKTAALIAQRSGNTSIRVKQYQAQVDAKAKAAAETVSQMAKKGGLSEEVIRQIEEQVLGIAR
jgi:hypothetical protein